MPKRPQPIPAHFWSTASGSEPVREWLKSLDKETRVVIGEDLRTLQFAWPVGMPLNRPLGKGLHELRSNLPGHRTARLIFTHCEDSLVILHGFIKKDKKIPKADLDLARKRRKELESA